MKTIFIIASLLISLASFAETKKESAIMYDIKKEAHSLRNQKERELDSIYQKIKEKFRCDSLFLEVLDKSQKAWKKSVKADFNLKYPRSDKPMYYGSVFSVCSSDYWSNAIRQRIKFLSQWLNGIEEGDVCRGSVPFN